MFQKHVFTKLNKNWLREKVLRERNDKCMQVNDSFRFIQPSLPQALIQSDSSRFQQNLKLPGHSNVRFAFFRSYLCVFRMIYWHQKFWKAQIGERQKGCWENSGAKGSWEFGKSLILIHFARFSEHTTEALHVYYYNHITTITLLPLTKLL